jgi:hypothetical protein
MLYSNITLSISSYLQDTPSTINSLVIPTKGNFFQNLILYYSLTPVSFTYYNNPTTTGYILDYISKSVTTIANNAYTNNQFGSGELQVIFNLNNNWIFINVEPSTSYIIAIAEIFAIATGVAGIGRMIVQVVCSMIVRRYLFKFKCLRYNYNENYDINKLGLSAPTVSVTIPASVGDPATDLDTIRESISYVEKINMFESSKV